MKNMLKFFAALALALSLCACSAEELPKNDWKPAEEPEEIPDYFIAERFCGTDGGYIPTYWLWEEEGITFQSENSLLTVNTENEVINKTDFPEHPNFSGISLYPFGKYIIAGYENGEPWANSVAYYTESGKIGFLNTAIFTEGGELIKEYPFAEFDPENILAELPEIDGEAPVGYIGGIADKNIIIPLSGSKVFVRFFHALGVYDFETDEGKILFTLDGVKEEQGFESFIPGVLGGDFFLVGDKLWFGAEEHSENWIYKGVWCADENGLERYCDGELCFVNEEYIFIQKDGAVYFKPYGSGEFEKVFSGEINPYSCFIDGIFSSDVLYEDNKFFACDTNTGESYTFEAPFERVSQFFGVRKTGESPEYAFRITDLTVDKYWIGGIWEEAQTPIIEIDHSQNEDATLSLDLRFYVHRFQKEDGRSYIKIEKLPG